MRLAHHAMTFEGGWKNAGIQPSAQQLIADLTASGFHAVELDGDASRYGPAKTLRSLFDDAGITAVAISAPVTANPWPPNTEEYRRCMDYAAELGVRTISVCGGFIGRRRNTFASDYALFAQNLAAAQSYADQYGQQIAFHPHVGCIVETDAEVQKLLVHFPSLHLLLDTGHLSAVRENVTAFVQHHAQRILHVHLKDFDPTSDKFVELGCGAVDLPAILRALRDIGYAGALCVERDSPPGSGVDSARANLAHLHRLL
jgi:inosose dehydratase